MRIAYITDDNTEFETREEAERHEKVLESGLSIDNFLTELEAGDKKRTEYRKVIFGWEAFRVRKTPPAEEM